MKKRSLITISLLVLLNCFCFAETQGEKYFRTNKPNLAVTALESEILNGTAGPDAYNYLGLAYFQLADYKKSVEAFTRGLNLPGTDKKILAFNQGNAYYAMADYKNAAKAYSLTLAIDSSYTKALLNRANTYLMAEDYPACIKDYELYLEMEPNDPQRPQIEEILRLLRQHQEEVKLAEQKAIEDEKRKQEEDRRMKEELERQRIEEENRLAEQRRREEEEKRLEDERRKQLLEDVANSLQNTDSTNMTSGAEDIIDYDYQSELD
ncbi:MAG: tetratricopeptide repeat protein [Treponema sp.]|nr:tetratricopeptide repeat protein [Treponema sp.]